MKYKIKMQVSRGPVVRAQEETVVEAHSPLRAEAVAKLRSYQTYPGYQVKITCVEAMNARSE